MLRLIALAALAILVSTQTASAQSLTADDLWEAARNGDLATVQKAIADGVDVNSPTDYNSTALSFAADRGHLEIAKFLIEKGADPNITDTFYNATPMTWAQMRGNFEIMGALYGAGASGADEALSSAVRSNNLEFTRAILDSGAVNTSGFEAARKIAAGKTEEEALNKLFDREITTRPDFTITAEQAKQYEGTYAGDNQKITVTAKEDRLKIQRASSKSFLKPVSENVFKQGSSTYRFIMDGDEVAQVELLSFRQTTVLKPVDTDAEIAEAKPETEKMEEEKAEPAEAEEKVYLPSSPESKAADLAISSANWPGFRGNGSRGVADGQSPPTEWDADTNLVWKTNVPGLGNSCPTIWGKKLFITSAVNPNADNDFRIGLYGDVESVEEDFEFEFKVTCLDKTSGEVLWERLANKAKPAVKRHAKSTHANPSVATDGKHVIAFFGSEGLYCYDMEGELVWKKDLGVLDSGWFYDPGYQWGFGASPTIFENMVIIQCDIQKDSYIAAYNIATGDEIWKTDRPGEIPSWSSPIVHEFDGTAMLLTHATRAARGYDARTGAELWSMRDHSEIVVPTPFVAHGLIYIASGYSPIQPIVAIRPDSRGDITLPEDSLTSENIAWSTKRGGPYMPTPICYGDYLYCCSNNGVVACYEAKTGEVVYKKRLKASGSKMSFTGSPVAADGHLYFTTEDGVTLVVKAGPVFELVSTNKIGENVLTTPAISEGMFYIRAQQHVYAFGNSPK